MSSIILDAAIGLLTGLYILTSVLAPFYFLKIGVTLEHFHGSGNSPEEIELLMMKVIGENT